MLLNFKGVEISKAFFKSDTVIENHNCREKSNESRNHEKFDEGCPEEIEELVLKATSNDPNERPTAQELLEQAKAIQSKR